ncbi:MAG: response regulator [Sphingobacteriales bacterium]|nr:response regulator [Sphingobacteriales bacterium]
MNTPITYFKNPYSNYAFLFGIFPVLIGVSVLCGWYLEIDNLKSWFNSIIPMNPLTALNFIILGSWVTLKRSTIKLPGKQGISNVLLCSIAIIMMVLIWTIFFSADSSLDRIFFKSTLGANKMSEAIIVSFVFIVFAILSAQSKKSRITALSQYFIILPLYVSLIFICIYLFKISPIENTIIGAPLAINTSICFIFLSVAILFIHPNQGFIKNIIQNSTGGILARKILPLMIVVPILTGLLRLMGQHFHLYNTEFGTALLVVTVIILSCSHLIYHCSILNKIDVERSETENNLRISETTFSNAFNFSAIGIALVAPNGSWLNVNPALCIMLGYSQTELLSRSFQDITHPDDLDEDLEYVLKTLKGEIDNYQMEKRYFHKGGHIITVRLTVSLVRENGLPKYFVSQIVDISSIKSLIDNLKRKNKDLAKAKLEAEQAAAAKSEFLSTMSHEIRTPMNAVIGFTHLLLQNAREDQQEYLKMLRFSGENLLVLINDILDYNKIEAGKIELENVDFNVKDLLYNIQGGLIEKAKEKGILLKVLIDEELPEMVKGDPVRIGQILTNLASNAVKFTEEGGVTISTTLISQDTKGTLIHFEVRDTGIGIPKDKQDLVFDSFTQASSDTTRKYGGTGLGLAISKKLAQLYKSEIKLDSEPGKGSCFHFDITLKNSNHKTINLQNKPANAKKSLKGTIVLLAEDNKINVLLAKQFLKQWEIECDVAENGLIAFDMVQQKQYDLILMDLQMPVMDGYQSARQIRDLAPIHYKEIPIIALTASAMLEVRGKIMEAGMTDTVTKPFNPDELFAKISMNLKPPGDLRKY